MQDDRRGLRNISRNHALARVPALEWLRVTFQPLQVIFAGSTVRHSPGGTAPRYRPCIVRILAQAGDGPSIAGESLYV